MTKKMFPPCNRCGVPHAPRGVAAVACFLGVRKPRPMSAADQARALLALKKKAEIERLAREAEEQRELVGSDA